MASSKRFLVHCAACNKPAEAARMADGTIHYPYAWLSVDDRFACPSCQYELGLLAEFLAQLLAERRSDRAVS